MNRMIAMVLAAGVLAACSSPPSATVAGSADPAKATTNALAGTPVAVYGHDLNRAREVRNTVEAKARRQAAAIDAATGSSR